MIGIISWDRTFLNVLSFFEIEMIEEFKKWLEINRWYSEKTVDNYIRTIKKFDNYLKSISFDNRWVEQCEKIKNYDIEFFIQKEKLHWINTRTLNNYLSWIRTYLRFCVCRWFTVLDTRQILYLKEHKKKIESLSEEECKKLFEYFRSIKCKTRKQELIKTRNLLIVSMLLYTWLRISELSWIKIQDVQENMQIIWKWWIRRPITIMKEEMQLIRLYLFMRKDKSEWLFINHSHNYEWQRISSVAIEDIIREWWKKAWITHNIFPHMLRHTFATLLLRKQVSVYYIQKLLWHKNLNTTQTYLTAMNYELEEQQKKIPRF